jgi:EAL domain-containing protein (putative c-di-GMP-specific phosphodiesterase class I)
LPIAERLLAAFDAPFEHEGDVHALRASAGVALGDAQTSDPGTLLRDAGIAVDRAKTVGAKRVEIADADLRRSTADHAALERDLRTAVARGQIVVAYQPIVSVADGTTIGVEALARWAHPHRGLLAPAEFIALAEATGLIGGIGRAVLATACAQVAHWRAAGRALTCHVNLSPHQLTDPGLVADVGAVLDETGLEAGALVLEITESALMEGATPIERLQELRALGARLVLDDFGTGYSSLGRLRRCPVDGLKVDRSFVCDLPGDDGQDALLVAGILGMARALGLTVVAEGVETDAQLALLRDLGCRYAQGYLLSRPLDAAALGGALVGRAA